MTFSNPRFYSGVQRHDMFTGRVPTCGSTWTTLPYLHANISALLSGMQHWMFEETRQQPKFESN